MAKVSAVPAGMHTVIPVLTMKGCAEPIEFYKKASAAEELTRAPDPSGKQIWHAALRIGDSTIFLNDEMPEMESQLVPPGCGCTWTRSTPRSSERPVLD